jgi:hypothetical protein
MGEDVKRAFFSGPVSGLEVVLFRDSIAQCWYTFNIRGQNASPVSGLGRGRESSVYYPINSLFSGVLLDSFIEISMSPVSGHSNYIPPYYPK